MAATTSKKKIDHAIEAYRRLIKAFLRPNFDRACALSFGNTLRVESDFTTDSTALAGAIQAIAYANSNEKTRLWDSLADASLFFWKAGRRNVPWLIVAATDGADCLSSTFADDPAGCGAFLRHRFTSEPSNFMCLVGVGDDKTLDRPALSTFANHANCPAVTLAGFGFLEQLFLKIAVQWTTRLAGVRYTVGNLSWDEVRKIRNATQIPLDLMVLLDRSGSMFHQA